MSTAAKVPETWELTGDDARKTLLDTGRWQLLKDSFVRLRAADGFSHSRSLAFVTSLVLVQGLIALVGFAAAFGDVRMSREIVAAIQSAVPGPAGQLLTDAVAQARDVGADGPVPSVAARPDRHARHGDDCHGSDRAGFQPHLRHRA